jgi:hypothetical protein
MKKLIFAIVVVFLLAFTTETYSQEKKPSDVTVKTYKKKDGTIVTEHKRSAKNCTVKDNFSTKGNTNPYTGKKGYRKSKQQKIF